MYFETLQSDTIKWPPFPYKGLSYYEPEDSPIFAGRERDLRRFANVISGFPKRIVILHGRTGCGKSSFLRANVIPFLEKYEHGFQFLKTGETTPQKALFVRSTNAPLVVLSDTIFDFILKGFNLITPLGDEFMNLSKALLGYTEGKDFIENTSKNPELMIKVLSILSGILPRTLVIVIDQAEEVLTMELEKEGNKSRSLFFQFLSLFSKIEIDIKILIAIRTEYYGEFYNAVHQYGLSISSVDDYFLNELDENNLIKAIARPTSREDYKRYGCPRDQYKFSYEKNLPEIIAKDLIKATPAGGLLPVMQIVCARLYSYTKHRSQDVISKKYYKKLGKVEGQVEAHLDEVLTELCIKNAIDLSEIKSEVSRWKNILLMMKKTQTDGTVTTDLKTEDDLTKAASNEYCIIDVKKTLRFLSDDQQRIIRKNEVVNVENGLNVTYYSLGHDAIGLALKNYTPSPSRKLIKSDIWVDTDKPAILYYGSREILNKNIEIISNWADNIGTLISINLSKYTEDSQAVDSFLKDIIKKIEGDQETEDIWKHLEEAKKAADRRMALYGYIDVPDIFAPWSQHYMERVVKAFFKWLESNIEKHPTPFVFLIYGLEDIPTSLQWALELYVLPNISLTQDAKCLLFHEGNRQPSWKTYTAKDYVHVVSYANKELTYFKNPYIDSRPIRAEQFEIFFDRKDVIDHILEMLPNRSNAFVVTSEAKMGKTSLLLNFENMIPEDQKEYFKHYIPVYVNFSIIDKPEHRNEQTKWLMWYLAYEIYEKLNEKNILDISAPKLDDFSDSPINHFNNIFRQIGNEKTILLLIDQFDSFDSWIGPDKEEPLEFLKFLRYHFDNPDYLAFIFAGTERLKQLAERFPEFFTVPCFLEIGLFDEKDAKMLIEEPVSGVIEYEPDAVNHALALGGRHPCLTQALCYDLVENAKRYSRGILTKKNVETAANTVLKDRHLVFKTLWDSCNEKQKQILIQLVYSTIFFEEPCDFEHLKTVTSDIKHILKSLIKKGLIDLNIEKPKLSSGMFYLWIKNNIHDESVLKDKKQYMSDDEKKYQEAGQTAFNKAYFKEAAKMFREAKKITEDNDRRREYEFLEILIDAYQNRISGKHSQTAKHLSHLISEIDKLKLLAAYREKLFVQSKISREIVEFESASPKEQLDLPDGAFYLFLHYYQVGLKCRKREAYIEAVINFHLVCEKAIRYRLYAAYGIDAQNARLDDDQLNGLKNEKEKILGPSASEEIKLTPMDYFDCVFLLKFMKDDMILKTGDIKEIEICNNHRIVIVHGKESASKKQLDSLDKISQKYIESFYNIYNKEISFPLDVAKNISDFIEL